MVTSIYNPFHITRFQKYSKNNLPFVLSRALCDAELQWERLLNTVILKYKPGSKKIDHDCMPKARFNDFKVTIIIKIHLKIDFTGIILICSKLHIYRKLPLMSVD